MAERHYLRLALDSNAEMMRQAQAVRRKPLLAYPEHRDVKKQLDFVTKLRVGIRLSIARCYREESRGRPDRALMAAARAGRHWAEYREHWALLRSLPKYRHVPIYGKSAPARARRVPR